MGGCSRVNEGVTSAAGAGRRRNLPWDEWNGDLPPLARFTAAKARTLYLSCGEWRGDLPPLARDMAVLTVASTGSIWPL